MKKPEFFLGNENDSKNEEEKEDTGSSMVKSELLENDTSPEIDSIEEIDTGNTNDQMVQNVIEEDVIKAEPENNSFEFSNKISDGIDHSALEGMVNLCEDR